MTRARLEDRFLLQFNHPAKVFATAPGRINLLGEHTDYNQGYVLPASIDQVAIVALRQNNFNQYRLVANDLWEGVEVDVDKLVPNENQWANYLLGVIDQLQKRGFEIPPFDCSMACEVPEGAGLSSSAAIQCALITGLNKLFNLRLDQWEMVRIGQVAENDFVGANTGILDQFASIFGETDTALLLDCRSFEIRKLAINLPGHQLIALNTGVKHNHLLSAYADRRADCERAIALLQKSDWQGTSLRDLREADLDNAELYLDEDAHKRATFIYYENQRTLTAADQLKSGDVRGFGESLTAGHWGLSMNFEVSCPESDAVVRFAEKHTACKGARQMGGGFGGCILCVVETKAIDAFIDEAQQDYFNHFAITLEPIDIQLGPGARII